MNKCSIKLELHIDLVHFIKCNSKSYLAKVIWPKILTIPHMNGKLSHQQCIWMQTQTKEFQLKRCCIRRGSFWLWTFPSENYRMYLPTSERDVLNCSAFVYTKTIELHTTPPNSRFKFSLLCSFRPWTTLGFMSTLWEFSLKILIWPAQSLLI